MTTDVSDDNARPSTRVPADSFRDPSLRDVLASTVSWVSALSFFAWIGPLMTVTCATRGLDASLPMQRFFVRYALRFLGVDVESVVHPSVDPKRAYMFVHNHTNHFDFIFMHNITPHYKRGLELESHFDIPIYGAFMKYRGGIPVRPGAQGQSPEILAQMRAALDMGHAILAFPEGTRTQDGRLGHFRKGVFFLARDLGIPIVPVTVTGAFDMMRKGSLLIRPGQKLNVYVDAPIETQGLSDEEIPTLVDRVHAAMSERIDSYWRDKGWTG